MAAAQAAGGVTRGECGHGQVRENSAGLCPATGTAGLRASMEVSGTSLTKGSLVTSPGPQGWGGADCGVKAVG